MAKNGKTYRALKLLVGSEKSSWFNEYRKPGEIVDVSHLTAGELAMMVERGALEEVPAAIVKQWEKSKAHEAEPTPDIQIETEETGE